MYKAEVIEHSVGPNKIPLITIVATYPRYIHAEVMTHRVFSRNASSSRAIPTAKLVENSLCDMVYPIKWGLNQPGMQASEVTLSPTDELEAAAIWKGMAEYCAKGVEKLANLGPINPKTQKPVGIHKQWANRPLEWFGNITVVITSTEWSNFFELRDHPMAQPEIQELARVIKQAIESSTPRRLACGDMHLPFITEDERSKLSPAELMRMSTARCARVSYLTHEGKEPSIIRDLQLYNDLVGSVPLHASPSEHQAVACMFKKHTMSGNFRGWVQHRKLIEDLMYRKESIWYRILGKILSW